MKKGFLFFSFIALIVAVVWFTRSQREQWQTFVKKENQMIKSYPTTQAEKKVAKIDTMKPKSHQDLAQNRATSPDSAKRNPASQKDNSSQRKLHKFPGQFVKEDAGPLNKPHKEWKKRFGSDLLRFMRPETKVFLKKLESLTIYKKGHPFYVEKVHVKLTTPEGRLFSYNALVDSETGKIVETWNQTNHEPLGHQRPKISPSGAITKDDVIRF